MDIGTLLKTLESHRDKVIVTTNGVFDLLHVGHVRYLEEAKALGDILVVAVNSDSSVKENKGPARPFNSEKDRAEVLAALACVDYVTIFNEKTPVEVLRKLKPAIHVKGGDYVMEQIVERQVVEEGGGKVVLLNKIDCASTTDIAAKIRAT
ncbi:D-glycero-beta-D-manno-heptose 1-phosphate adenylyltransferase [Patescibacteria group bacterium]|nr:D-glycero-beta-D-manno-heptose 1-phosphate adenylyltransferase [Patescibacteria group bacterium]